ncbi:hypothetical protein GCM10027578_34370 [Spirosoma luteolum]
MIEQGVKSVTQWVSNLLASVLSLLKVAVRLRYRTQLPARRQPVCAVLGNGPSLNESLRLHTDFLRQTELVCVNNFAHSPVFAQLRPQNYVLFDPAYFTYAGLPTDRADIRQTVTALAEQVDWPLTLYVPQFARGSWLTQRLAEKNPNIQLAPFNYTVVDGFRALRFWLCARGLGMMQAQNVIIATLSLMINRRFDTIYLFGADTSWHEQIRVSNENQLLMQQTHFYEKADQVAHVPVYADARQQHSWSMASQFLSIHKVFRGYDRLADYARHRGVAVFNASARSYIDAFTRVALPPGPSSSVRTTTPGSTVSPAA